MKTKNVILEGKEYQIDIERAKELGVLKEKDTRCKSWEDYCEKHKSTKSYYLNTKCNRIEENVFPTAIAEQLTKDDAIAISAFSRLLKLRRDWIGTWEPDWFDGSVRKYYIYFRPDKFYIDYHYDYSRVFSFPTKEMAIEFLECFRNLFEDCKFLI